MLTLLLLPCFLLIRKIGEWKYTKKIAYLLMGKNFSGVAKSLEGMII